MKPEIPTKEIIRHLMHRDCIALDFEMCGDMKYRTNLRFMPCGGATMRALGYIRGYNMFDNLALWGFPVWVRFHGFTVMDKPVDESGRANLETSSTLEDFYMSDSAAQFVKGMTTGIKLPPMDMKKMGMVAMMAIGVVLGLYFLGVF